MGIDWAAPRIEESRIWNNEYVDAAFWDRVEKILGDMGLVPARSFSESARRWESVGGDVSVSIGWAPYPSIGYNVIDSVVVTCGGNDKKISLPAFEGTWETKEYLDHLEAVSNTVSREVGAALRGMKLGEDVIEEEGVIHWQGRGRSPSAYNEKLAKRLGAKLKSGRVFEKPPMFPGKGKRGMKRSDFYNAIMMPNNSIFIGVAYAHSLGVESEEVPPLAQVYLFAVENPKSARSIANDVHWPVYHIFSERTEDGMPMQYFAVLKGAQAVREDVELDEARMFGKHEMKAFKMGREAFLAGKKRVPAADKGLIPMLKKKGQGTTPVQVMKAWIKGWDMENLSAQHEDVDLGEGAYPKKSNEIKDTSELKVGDRVYSVIYRDYGKIIKVSKKSVQVKFDGGGVMKQPPKYLNWLSHSDAKKASFGEDFDLDEGDVYNVLARSKADNPSGEAQKLAVRIRKEIERYMPPGAVLTCEVQKSLGEKAIYIVTALEKDISKVPHKIWMNDRAFQKFFVYGVNEDDTLQGKLQAELIQGGKLLVKPEPGSHMAFGSVKFGWRKKSGTPDQIVKHFGNYFKRVQKTIKDSKGMIPEAVDGVMESSMNAGTKKVIDAFLDKKPMDGKKLSTDGKRLDGEWIGGRGIAQWDRGKIYFNDLGSKAAQTIQRAIKKAAPKNWLGEDVELSEAKYGYYVLLSKVSPSGKWSVEFGDRDKDAVKDERESFVSNGHKASLLKIVGVKNSWQKNIDAVVNKLNEDVELDETTRNRRGLDPKKTFPFIKRALLQAGFDFLDTQKGSMIFRNDGRMGGGYVAVRDLGQMDRANYGEVHVTSGVPADYSHHQASPSMYETGSRINLEALKVATRALSGFFDVDKRPRVTELYPKFKRSGVAWLDYLAQEDVELEEGYYDLNKKALTPTQLSAYEGLSDAAKRLFNDLSTTKGYKGGASSTEARVELSKKGLAKVKWSSDGKGDVVVFTKKGKSIASKLFGKKFAEDVELDAVRQMRDDLIGEAKQKVYRSTAELARDLKEVPWIQALKKDAIPTVVSWLAGMTIDSVFFEVFLADSDEEMKKRLGILRSIRGADAARRAQMVVKMVKDKFSV